jgi:hypothetical protein
MQTFNVVACAVIAGSTFVGVTRWRADHPAASQRHLPPVTTLEEGGGGAVDPDALLDGALAKGEWTRTDAHSLRVVIRRTTSERRAAVLSRLTTAINDGKLRLASDRLF